VGDLDFTYCCGGHGEAVLLAAGACVRRGCFGYDAFVDA